MIFIEGLKQEERIVDVYCIREEISPTVGLAIALQHWYIKGSENVSVFSNRTLILGFE